ncbi:Bile salt export pump [Frankliniella fusca]|uniref:Bile salt export pump n=1 Tax=Frankliniella fusca TaxID=407009 RepID=A0AAE1HZL3_9NEOP|nr:Bile salt export pump [Frankliniella fusca]
MSPGRGSELRLRVNAEAAAPAGKGGAVPTAASSAAAGPAPSTEFKSPLDKKYHVERSAILGLGKSPSLSGFMNLLFCLTTLAGTGLLLENLNKYGFRVAMTQWMHAFDARRNVPGFYPAVYLFA